MSPRKSFVIDTSNYYPGRDGAIIEVDDGKPVNVWVSEQFSRPVIKAWNAVLAATLADNRQPTGSSTRIGLHVAGDDTHAEAVAQDLVEDTGFIALAAGSLEDSWRQQPGTPAYCTELTLPELKMGAGGGRQGTGTSKPRTHLSQKFYGSRQYSLQMSKLLPQIALGRPDYRIRRDSLLEFRLIDLVAKLISLRKQGTADACLTQRLDEAANFLTCPVSRLGHVTLFKHPLNLSAS